MEKGEQRKYEKKNCFCSREFSDSLFDAVMYTATSHPLPAWQHWNQLAITASDRKWTCSCEPNYDSMQWGMSIAGKISKKPKRRKQNRFWNCFNPVSRVLYGIDSCNKTGGWKSHVTVPLRQLIKFVYFLFKPCFHILQYLQ